MVKKIITNQYDIEMHEDEVKLESVGEDAYFNFLYSFKQSDRIAYRKTRLCDLIYNFELDSTFPHKAHIDAFLPEIYGEYETSSEKIKGIALHHIATSYWCGVDVLETLHKSTNGNLNLEYKSKQGKTPLMVALFSKCDNVAKKIIDLGAKVDAFDELNRPVAHYALFGSNESRFISLEEMGISFNDVNDPRACFSLAGGFCENSGLVWLIDHAKMDPNIVDCFGRTPIFYAEQNRNIENIYSLLEHNVDIKKEGKLCAECSLNMRLYNDALKRIGNEGIDKKIELFESLLKNQRIESNN